MLLVVVYGVYTLFFSSPSPKALVSSDKDLETLNAFIAKVADKTKSGLSKQQAYILGKAQAWTNRNRKNFFITKTRNLKSTKFIFSPFRVFVLSYFRD